uniref:NB-ARC domain-containing protein n=1 Tax=Kalanchoe fedtschenkoi TaxID=63787 RepID=A0A7N0RD34_KALFE
TLDLDAFLLEQFEIHLNSVEILLCDANELIKGHDDKREVTLYREERISTSLVNKTSSIHVHYNSLELLQQKLRKKLLDKRFLVVLECKCRAIITTRTADVELYSLYENNVFQERNSTVDPKLKAMRMKIVRRCDGLPLAINMIGELLISIDYDVTEWEKVLNNKFWENTDIIPHFNLLIFICRRGTKLFCILFDIPKRLFIFHQQIT